MPWSRLRTYRTLPEAHLALNELLHTGMTGEVRGQQRASLAGEIPFADARIELWVASAQVDAAEALLADIDVASQGPSKVCARCSEECPSTFELCWRCGAGL